MKVVVLDELQQVRDAAVEFIARTQSVQTCGSDSSSDGMFPLNLFERKLKWIRF